LVHLKKLRKLENLKSKTIRDLKIKNFKYQFKEEIKIRNSIDQLEREAESQEKILNAEFSVIKENNNNEVNPRSHG